MARWKSLGYGGVVLTLFALNACGSKETPQQKVTRTLPTPDVTLAENKKARPATQVGTVDGFQIEEKEPARVGLIKIVGNNKTEDSIIRREMTLNPGQILSYPDMVETQRNLERLGIFEESKVEVENPELDEPFKNILVTVKEKTGGKLGDGSK